MIKVKLEKKNKDIIFKMKVSDKDKNEIILKRALMEGKKIKGNSIYNYEVPLRYFFPIMSNIEKDKITIDRYSIDMYLEFSDSFDEQYYISTEATPLYMKKWRKENCPNIYKITINKSTKEVEKIIAFKKHSLKINLG